ncbi:hypothetical protein GGS26DRAFT_601352, partial [Hypomontagnella submonticulosa]
HIQASGSGTHPINLPSERSTEREYLLRFWNLIYRLRGVPRLILGRILRLFFFILGPRRSTTQKRRDRRRRERRNQAGGEPQPRSQHISAAHGDLLTRTLPNRLKRRREPRSRQAGRTAAATSRDEDGRGAGAAAFLPLLLLREPVVRVQEFLGVEPLLIAAIVVAPGVLVESNLDEAVVALRHHDVRASHRFGELVDDVDIALALEFISYIPALIRGLWRYAGRVADGGALAGGGSLSGSASFFLGHAGRLGVSLGVH